jgi:outer membrane protein assembly factor BamC
LLLPGAPGSLIEGKKIDYKSAGNVKPLDVPADLSTPPTSDRYNIPDSGAGTATASEYTEGQSSRPAGAGPAPVLPTQEKVRLDRGGSQRWLVVDAHPEALWP